MLNNSNKYTVTLLYIGLLISHLICIINMIFLKVFNILIFFVILIVLKINNKIYLQFIQKLNDLILNHFVFIFIWNHYNYILVAEALSMRKFICSFNIISQFVTQCSHIFILWECFQNPLSFILIQRWRSWSWLAIEENFENVPGIKVRPSAHKSVLQPESNFCSYFRTTDSGFVSVLCLHNL